MKYYARFYDSGRYVCGSSSVFILDGRNNKHTMINDCAIQLGRLAKFKSFYNGFAIFKALDGKFGGKTELIYVFNIHAPDAEYQENGGIL